jgi:hypothetical protein
LFACFAGKDFGIDRARNHRHVPTMTAAVLLVLVAIVYRVVLGIVGMPDTPATQWLHNFSPLAAIALCGAIFLPRRVAIVGPLLALFVSDLILNVRYGVALLDWIMLPQYLALGLVGALGWMLRSQARPGRTLLASVAASAFFFFITNTAAWFANPVYAKTAAGWTQAMTVGDLIHTPTIEFFRNTLVSDVLFTALFLGCMALVARPKSAPWPARREELVRW